MPNTNYSMLSVLDLCRRVEAGQLKPVDLINLCGQAVAAHEGSVGAFVSLDLEGARRIAEREGKALAAKPLRGLPVGIKDIFDTADFPTEYGSPIYAANRPSADAALVANVRVAGGIVVGKTVTTEFAYLHPSHTRNPRNPNHTPGGSSSGSAAAVACGMLPIALGSQTGGSIIRPAAFCGVAGFKPSFALLPTAGMKGMAGELDTAGLIAVGVADVACAVSAICGRDYRVDGGVPLEPRIALVRTDRWSEASEEMQAAVETALRAAEFAGAGVMELALPPIFEHAYRAHATIQQYQGCRSMAFEYGQWRHQLSPALRAAIEAGAAVTTAAFEDALRVANSARKALADLMAETDVLLTASALGAAPKGLNSTGTSEFNRLWTLLGTPCINVPGFVDDTGLPLGVQIVGRFGGDRQALHAAYFLERAIARYVH